MLGVDPGVAAGNGPENTAPGDPAGTGGPARALPITDSKGATSVAAVGAWSFEQAGGRRIRNHGVYRANTPGAYHAENGSRFFRNSG